MKIMTAMYTLRRGGAYDRFLMMLEAFLERNCEVHCLSLTPIQIKHPHFYSHVMYFPYRRKNGLIAKLVVLLIFPLWAIWIGWKNKIDLIIAFSSLYAFIQGLAKRFLGKKMVTFIRGRSSFDLKSQISSKWALYLNNFIENMGFHFSDRIITNNTSIQEEILAELGRENIDVDVLYNHIPPMNICEPEDILRWRDKYRIPGTARVLVAAGVLNRGKNIELLLCALPKIKEKDLFLLVIGEGSTKKDSSYLAYLKELAEKLDVKERVVFTGWLPKIELWKMLQASDLFLLPSLSEGMPNALLEAIGLNLACLGSRIPGIEDILYHDELMFDPLDEEVIAEKVSRFFSNGKYSNHVLQLCQERKETFFFDWKERVFQMVTQIPVGEDKTCRLR